MQLGNIAGTIPTEQQKSVKDFDYTNRFRQILRYFEDNMTHILSSKYLKIIHDLTSEVKYGDI